MVNVSEKEWQKYFVQLNEAEKKSVLLMLKIFLHRRGEGVKRINIEQYNKEIDEALAEVEEGDYISQDEMEKIAAKW
ncbi:MAG TPA: hypothetical protein VFF57_00280 [Hanamia sp.]|nr:hypothetical protein [Hanamia sp.]